MSDDVTIPGALARDIADHLREQVEREQSISARLNIAHAINLLDPAPPSLRVRVRRVASRNWKDIDDLTDAVLTVIADDIAGLPQVGIGNGTGRQFAYRVDDVLARLRGES